MFQASSNTVVTSIKTIIMGKEKDLELACFAAKQQCLLMVCYESVLL